MNDIIIPTGKELDELAERKREICSHQREEFMRGIEARSKDLAENLIKGVVAAMKAEPSNSIAYFESKLYSDGIDPVHRCEVVDMSLVRSIVLKAFVKRPEFDVEVKSYRHTGRSVHNVAIKTTRRGKQCQDKKDNQPEPRNPCE